jgi:phospholipid/cholesterol/gamma-HCH transport system ATP-binding protein
MILRLKARGVSSIFVTHDMPSAFAVCDRIAFLKEGRIEAIGRRSELESADGTSLLSRFIRGEEL